MAFTGRRAEIGEERIADLCVRTLPRGSPSQGEPRFPRSLAGTLPGPRSMGNIPLSRAEGCSLPPSRDLPGISGTFTRDTLPMPGRDSGTSDCRACGRGPVHAQWPLAWPLRICFCRASRQTQAPWCSLRDSSLPTLQIPWRTPQPQHWREYPPMPRAFLYSDQSPMGIRQRQHHDHAH